MTRIIDSTNFYRLLERRKYFWDSKISSCRHNHFPTLGKDCSHGWYLIPQLWWLLTTRGQAGSLCITGEPPPLDRNKIYWTWQFVHKYIILTLYLNGDIRNIQKIWHCGICANINFLCWYHVLKINFFILSFNSQDYNYFVSGFFPV